MHISHLASCSLGSCKLLMVKVIGKHWTIWLTSGISPNLLDSQVRRCTDETYAILQNILWWTFLACPPAPLATSSTREHTRGNNSSALHALSDEAVWQCRSSNVICTDTRKSIWQNATKGEDHYFTVWPRWRCVNTIRDLIGHRMCRRQQRMLDLYPSSNKVRCDTNIAYCNRACKSRARKRGWGQLGAGSPYSPC